MGLPFCDVCKQELVAVRRQRTSPYSGNGIETLVLCGCSPGPEGSEYESDTDDDYGKSRTILGWEAEHERHEDRITERS